MQFEKQPCIQHMHLYLHKYSNYTFKGTNKDLKKHSSTQNYTTTTNIQKKLFELGDRIVRFG